VAAGAGDVALRAVSDDTAADLLVWGAQLNEGSFALAYEQTDDGQTLKDRSGREQTGMLGSTLGADSNDPMWKQHRLDFDGVDDRVEAPNNGIFATAGDVTVHTWVRPRTFTGWDSLLAFGTGGDEFLFALNGGKSAVYSNHAVPSFVTSPATLNAGSWAFVSLVRNGGQVHFYRNTTKDATLTWDNFALRAVDRHFEESGLLRSFARRARTWRAHEQALAVGQDQVAAVRAVRAVARPVADHRDLGTDRYDLRCEAAPEQGVRCATLYHPSCGRAIGVLDVDMHPGVGIQPLHLRDDSVQFHGLVGIELGGERMVRGCRTNEQSERHECGKPEGVVAKSHLRAPQLAAPAAPCSATRFSRILRRP
jgi:hypothetical protein